MKYLLLLLLGGCSSGLYAVKLHDRTIMKDEYIYVCEDRKDGSLECIGVTEFLSIYDATKAKPGI